MAWLRRVGVIAGMSCGMLAEVGDQPAVAQQFGPTTVATVGSGVWPARPPQRVYVMPFFMDPALKAELAQASAGVIPQGPLRQMLADRPRVTDLVTGGGQDIPIGAAVAKLVADDMAQAGWPVVFWPQPTPPPADGWRLQGQVVLADEGSAAARNIIGFGVGNKHVGIDVALSDPATAGGQPFLVLNSSDRGRLTPGTAAVGALAGFNPAVVIGKHVASTSGIADITQQQRLAQEISVSVAEAVNQHMVGRPR